MGKNKILIGNDAFYDKSVIGGNVYISNSIVGGELTVDTADVELDLSTSRGTIFRPKGSAGLLTADKLLYTVQPRFLVLAADLSKFAYGTPVELYHNEALIGRFYFSSAKRVGQYLYAVSCVSAVGILDALKHYGGLYSGEPLSAVLADVIGGAVPYTVDDEVASIRVYGWLPVASRRDNLRQLLFAYGCALKKDLAGQINVTQLDVSTPKEIGDDRLAVGGSVDYPGAVSDVVVVEHGYIQSPSDKPETLYDGSAQGQEIISPKGISMVGNLLTFNEPMYDLSPTGAAILEFGVNYAILAPGTAVLTGKKYTHTTREIYALGGPAAEKNIARVEDATLVNATNSDEVAQRVAAYYSASRTVTMDMVLGNERPGDGVIINDPFSERTVALLASQDINLSGTLIASTQFIAGYTPRKNAAFEHVEILTSDGSWTVPPGVYKILVVSISGGSAGSPGEDGEAGGDGGSAGNWSVLAGAIEEHGPGLGSKGKGGAGGLGGSGGRVYQKTMLVDPGDVFSAIPGKGGLPGQSGTDSRFGDVTSAGGIALSSGFLEVITGQIFGGDGNPGIPGGQGGGASDGTYGLIGGEGTEGESVTGPDGTVWLPGTSSRMEARVISTRTSGKVTVSGAAGEGAGGGAAVGSNGENGETGTSSASASSTKMSASAHGGKGGKGGDATQPEKQAQLGRGGTGGNGGGGGGGGGCSIYHKGTSSAPFPTGINWEEDLTASTGGEPGKGSLGGVGGDGVIIIYY